MITKRPPTRQVSQDWPFLYSLNPKRGIVLNVRPEAQTPVEPTTTKRRARLRPDLTTSTAWPFKAPSIAYNGVDLSTFPEAPF